MNATGERTAGSSAGTQANIGEFPREGCEPAIAIGTQKLDSCSDPPLALAQAAHPAGSAARRGVPGTPGPSEPDGPRPTGAFCSEIPAASLPPAPLTAAPGQTTAPWMRTHLTGI